MQKKTCSILLFSTILTLFSGTIQGQVRIDTTALQIFWEIADTLDADQMPSDKLWQKFSSHPAYAQIQRSGNRVSFLKKVLPIVFQPSQSERLKKLLAGKDTPYQYFALHLVEVKQKRQELDAYLRSGQWKQYGQAYRNSFRYLPKDIAEQVVDLTVYLALFEDNGFGGEVITMDLLHLSKGTDAENSDFFGHEFHHALRLRTKLHQLYNPKESEHYPIVVALGKLPLEGVASMLDKGKYFTEAYLRDSASMDINQLETVKEFRALVTEAPTNLARIDSVLVADMTFDEKGTQIFTHLPWSGHVIGYYMATNIEKVLGKEILIAAQYSCLDFVLAYQQAALKDSSMYRFSDAAIAVLEKLKE